jgi:hypothetical protein
VLYGLINLVRHYPARYVEKAAELAKAHDLKSSKAMRRIVESMAAEADSCRLKQDHPHTESLRGVGSILGPEACGLVAEPEAQHPGLDLDCRCCCHRSFD